MLISTHEKLAEPMHNELSQPAGVVLKFAEIFLAVNGMQIGWHPTNLEPDDEI
jgi:hypothetical protein